MSAIRLERSDVLIRKMEKPHCHECHGPATHEVLLDLRNADMTPTIESYLCLPCAKELAARIKKGLPR